MGKSTRFKFVFFICLVLFTSCFIGGCVTSTEKASVYQPKQDYWTQRVEAVQAENEAFMQKQKRLEAESDNLLSILKTPGKYPTAQDLKKYETASKDFLGAQRTASLMTTITAAIEKKSINEYVELNKGRLLNGDWPEVQAELNQMYKNGDISASTFKKLSDAIEPIGKRGTKPLAPEPDKSDQGHDYSREVSI